MVVPVRIELLTTGTELLLGTTRDTHGAWVGQRLLGLGLRIARQVTVPDGQAVGKAMRTGLEEGEVLIVTGGLGPTSDDLTREGLVEVLGPLSPLVSRHGIRVTPYVGLVPDYVEYKANDAEIASVFSVPLEFFRNDPREVTHRIDYLGQSWYVPSYTYDQYRIWGLTAIMVVELVNLLYDAGIALHQPPEHFIHLR